MNGEIASERLISSLLLLFFASTIFIKHKYYSLIFSASVVIF